VTAISIHDVKQYREPHILKEYRVRKYTKIL